MIRKKIKLNVIILLLTLVTTFSLCTGAWAGYTILISKANNKLALYQNNAPVRTFPVATGRHPSFTPEGKFTIVSKHIDPYYARGKIPGGSPHNPLGPRWLGLSIGGGGIYGIHGNNNPASIGTYASEGCIRMNNQDVIWLYDKVPLGTPVTINNALIEPVAQTTPAAEKEAAAIKLLVHDKIISLPDQQKPKEEKDHIYIPLRPALQELGYEMMWHPEYRVVEINSGLDKSFIDLKEHSTVINGQSFELPAHGFIKEGVTFLPMEFYNLLTGITAQWDREQRLVTLAAQINQYHTPELIETEGVGTQ